MTRDHIRPPHTPRNNDKTTSGALVKVKENLESSVNYFFLNNMRLQIKKTFMPNFRPFSTFQLSSRIPNGLKRSLKPEFLLNDNETYIRNELFTFEYENNGRQN